MAVIKSNAYGHGIRIVAQECARNISVDALGVASVEEALLLLKEVIHKPIIVLSILDIKETAKMTQTQLNLIRLPLYDMPTAQRLLKMLKKRNLRARVHIKIDTGTSRIGFLPSQIISLAKFLHSAKRHITFEALYTHFADAENNKIFTLKQNKLLLEMKKRLYESGFKNFYTHSACTEASLHTETSRLDMIRLGLGLYGLNPTPKTSAIIKKNTGLALKPVLSWYTKLIQIKTLSPGSTVGYGRTFTVHKKTTIGILPVGYFDGYDRKLSNKGSVVVRGRVCPVIGRVCMNLTMIDVSVIAKEIREMETATLIGDNAKETSADTIARHAGTINYEIVTRINPEIPRIHTT